MAIHYAPGKKTASASTRLVIAALFGVAVCVIAGLLGSWKLAPLIAWDGAALLYLAWIGLTIWRLDNQSMPDFARREDPSRAATDATLVVAALFSLGALGVVLAQASNSQGLARFLQIGLGVISVVLAWVVVHTVYMLRYAELYYAKPEGGVNFEGTAQPSYTDFAYLAFTMGMTFQVSDTNFKSSKFRSAALRHALLSYIFGTVIVATTINLVVSLTSS